MACGSGNKMPSFLTLVKEEPLEAVTAMDTNCRPLPLAVGSVVNQQPQPTGLPESQLQPPLPMSHLSVTNLPTQRPLIHRGEIDPNFEPVSRGRSNTWPLPCPEGFLEGEEMPPMAEPSASGEQNRLTGGIANFAEAVGGAPKKNTSRRNPWGNMSYADLIAQAIMSSPEGRATLSQIYDWMVQNVPYFKDKGDSNSSAGWKNSIRHNLSLHSRFMRMQNEGTGKSSWWVLNPDAKPGKSTRRRANTLEGAGGRLEKKRGRMRKKVDSLRNGLDAPVSPSDGPLDYYPTSPSSGLHTGFQLSPQDYRPRASSNASSCGRLSPIPSVDADMHDSQVPPLSPGLAGWGPEYWPAANHIHGPPPPPHLMGRHPHQEHYADQLVDSIGEGLTLGTRENWPPLNGFSHHNGTNSDCMKMQPHSLHHMNGFMNPHHHHNHHQAFSSYEDFAGYAAANAHNRGYPPPLHEKTNQQRHIHHFQVPPIQNVSPAQSLSPPNGVCDGPSFSSPPQSHHQTPTSNNLRTPPAPTPNLRNAPSGQPHTTPPMPHRGSASPTSSSNNSPLTVAATSTTQSPNGSNMDHHQHPSPEPTAMLRVAFSHREASSCAHDASNKPACMGQFHQPGHGVGDLTDLDAFQGGLECNVEEHGQGSYNHGHPSYGYLHSSSQLAAGSVAAPPSAVHMHPCSSIQTGNHWVR